MVEYILLFVLIQPLPGDIPFGVRSTHRIADTFEDVRKCNRIGKKIVEEGFAKAYACAEVAK